MDNIIIVNSYTNTKEKEDILYGTLLQLRKTPYKILVVSNTPATTRIFGLCDYYLFDKEDILLPIEKSPLKWFADNTETIHLYSKGPGYSIVKNLSNAVSLAKNLKFTKFISMEYDNIIDNKDLPLLDEIFTTLDTHDGFFCEFNSHGYAVETRIFGGRIGFFTDKLYLPNTYEVWNKTEPFCSIAETLEYIFPVILEPHRDNIKFFHGYNKDYFRHSKIDIVSSTREISIVYNEEDRNTPLLFLIGTGKTYQIFINKKHIETIYLNVGQTKKYYLDISDEEIIVEVKHDGLESVSTVNADNIDTYKVIGKRISL